MSTPTPFPVLNETTEQRRERSIVEAVLTLQAALAGTNASLSIDDGRAIVDLGFGEGYGMVVKPTPPELPAALSALITLYGMQRTA